jgi:hypothetical protein
MSDPRSVTRRIEGRFALAVQPAKHIIHKMIISYTFCVINPKIYPFLFLTGCLSGTSDCRSLRIFFSNSGGSDGNINACAMTGRKFSGGSRSARSQPATPLAVRWMRPAKPDSVSPARHIYVHSEFHRTRRGAPRVRLVSVTCVACMASSYPILHRLRNKLISVYYAICVAFAQTLRLLHLR